MGPLKTAAMNGLTPARPHSMLTNLNDEARAPKDERVSANIS